MGNLIFRDLDMILLLQPDLNEPAQRPFHKRLDKEQNQDKYGAKAGVVKFTSHLGLLHLCQPF